MQIVFEPFDDLRPGVAAEESLGKSVGSMLLFRLRTIQSVHQRAVKRVGVSNPYEDVPKFSEGIDEDLELLASADLGESANRFSAVLEVLVRFGESRPRLSGTIQEPDGVLCVQAVLEKYDTRPKKTRRPTRLWEVPSAEATERSTLSNQVEELAYRIYLDLLEDEVFKTWQCFKYFTDAFQAHADYDDLKRTSDFDEANALYRKAREDEPGNAVVSYNLGVLLYMEYKEPMNAEAIECFRPALTAANVSLRARANSAMANALVMKFHRFHTAGEQELRNAIAYAERATQLAPKMDAARKAWGFANHQESERLAALASLPRTEDSSYAEKFIEAHVAAIQGYRKATKINDRHYVAFNNWANLHLEYGKALDGRSQDAQLKKALELADDALERAPGYHHAHDNKGNVLYEQGKFDEAARSYSDALVYVPDYPEAQNDLALLTLERAGLPSKLPSQAEGVHEKQLDELKNAYEMHLEALRMVSSDEQQQKADKQQKDGKKQQEAKKQKDDAQKEEEERAQKQQAQKDKLCRQLHDRVHAMLVSEEQASQGSDVPAPDAGGDGDSGPTPWPIDDLDRPSCLCASVLVYARGDSTSAIEHLCSISLARPDYAEAMNARALMALDADLEIEDSGDAYDLHAGALELASDEALGSLRRWLCLAFHRQRARLEGAGRLRYKLPEKPAKQCLCTVPKA